MPRVLPSWVGGDLVQCILMVPSPLFPGTFTPRVPCMERGRGTNHVTPSNDTSWSAHHPLWLKLKQIKPLPVIRHLRGSSPPSMASSPEKPAHLGPTKRAQPSCCHHLCFSPEELRDFALVFRKQNPNKPQGPM